MTDALLKCLYHLQPVLRMYQLFVIPLYNHEPKYVYAHDTAQHFVV